MKLIFQTETESIYILTKNWFGRMRWQRVKSNNSGMLRKEKGILLSWPAIVVGERARLEDSKIQPGCTQHFVHTSRVTGITTKL